ncbi:MAG: hypothetical protein IPM39_29430 [Chloroflexi bacterium]|nr:hypothetical protein [Chloroflexota bacterium]
MKRVLDWFEQGDLVPLAVLISVAHYGPVLMAHGEFWLVAWAVGALVDLLHFRSVRYAFSSRLWLAGVVAAATTIMATGYHLRFYAGDWLLALPIPIGIAILAWHASEKERGMMSGQLAIVEGQLAERASQMQDLERALQEANGLLTDQRQKLQANDKRLTEVLQSLQESERRWLKLGPVGQDFIRLLAGDGMNQVELARKHGLTESAVSRIKSTLNGGG